MDRFICSVLVWQQSRVHSTRLADRRSQDNCSARLFWKCWICQYFKRYNFTCELIISAHVYSGWIWMFVQMVTCHRETFTEKPEVFFTKETCMAGSDEWCYIRSDAFFHSVILRQSFIRVAWSIEMLIRLANCDIRAWCWLSVIETCNKSMNGEPFVNHFLFQITKDSWYWYGDADALYVFIFIRA